jgi:hypothetical protein
MSFKNLTLALTLGAFALASNSQVLRATCYDACWSVHEFWDDPDAHGYTKTLGDVVYYNMTSLTGSGVHAGADVEVSIRPCDVDINCFPPSGGRALAHDYDPFSSGDAILREFKHHCNAS